jgi:hypothetical protein
MRRRRPAGPVVSNEDGTFSINLSEDERATMTEFVGQLEALLAGGHTDERLRRLFPVAYHDDPDRDAEYQGYMRDELVQSRASSIQTVQEILSSADTISEAQLHAFMTVLNNLRLVLGTLLDVGEDDFDVEPDHPSFGQWELYTYLGWLLEWTVSALSEN